MTNTLDKMLPIIDEAITALKHRDAEIERLRGELAKPRRDRAYRAGLLDAVKIVEGRKCLDDCQCCKFIIAEDLRRAAEDVKVCPF